jgi:hypothetical protein
MSDTDANNCHHCHADKLVSLDIFCFMESLDDLKQKKVNVTVHSTPKAIFSYSDSEASTNLTDDLKQVVTKK